MSGVEKQRASRSPPLAVVKPVAERSGLVLESKLLGPAVRPEWIPRQRLITGLTVSKAKLVLVEAPAGFGKTILVAQWRSAASDDRSFAWVSLDQGDDDPVRLWWHVVSALERACPGLGDANLLRLLAMQDPDIDGQLLPRLVNVLTELSQPVALILDDYHLVSEPRCREQIQFLLLNLVTPAQMIIVTRADPPLPLARLRATGDLAEIGASELCFTKDEAATLVDRVAAVRLGERDLADLVDRTEGWPAGVYLAALSMRGRSDPGRFVHQLSGNNRYIADYLFEEVIAGQPSQVRRFLTETSILDRFTAPLCEAVTGVGNAAEIIDKLEREDQNRTAEKLKTFGITLDNVQAFLATPTEQLPGFNNLFRELEWRNVAEYCQLDLTVVRGLDYYSGIVFELFDRGKENRAIAGGGRYDQLISVISDGGADLPAAGFAIGDVVLRNLLEELPHTRAQAKEQIAGRRLRSYIVIAAEGRRPEAIKLANRLRASGISVDFALEPLKVAKQFQAAESLEAQYAIVVGQEWPEIKLKDLRKRVETAIPETQLDSALKLEN